MGYCDPTWISDYTWSAMFDRTIAISALSARASTRSLLVRIGTASGTVIVGERTLTPPRTRASTPFVWMHGDRVLAAGSAPTITQSHGDERLLVLPTPPARADGVMIAGALTAL